MIDFETLTDEELWQLADDANNEIARRSRIAQQETMMNELLTTGMIDTGSTSGNAWVQPTGAHNSYPLAWVVTHAGKTWESLVTGNVWEPGVSGWREVVTEGYSAWVQPTGAHDAYALGARVTHLSNDWESTVDANVWEPGVYGWTNLTNP